MAPFTYKRDRESLKVTALEGFVEISVEDMYMYQRNKLSVVTA